MTAPQQQQQQPQKQEQKQEGQSQSQTQTQEPTAPYIALDPITSVAPPPPEQTTGEKIKTAIKEAVKNASN